MNDTQRTALEQEFEEKRARLTAMMAQMDDMQRAWQQYEAAARAERVRAAFDALAAEEEEVARMQGHVERAAAEVKAAKRSGEKALTGAAEEALDAQRLALDLAVRHRDDARRAYDAALTGQGFDSEEAFRAACLTKPALAKLEETIMPFRTEYARLLSRCEEIETLLGEDD